MTPLQGRISRWAFWEDRTEKSVLKSGTPGKSEFQPGSTITAQMAHAIKTRQQQHLDVCGLAALDILGHTIPDGAPLHIVFASRYGNLDRTLQHLSQLASNVIPLQTDADISAHDQTVTLAPAINCCCLKNHTRISVGNDSLIAALTETICQLTSEDGPVILCYLDLPLPGIDHGLDCGDKSATALAIRFDQPTEKAGRVFSFDPIPDYHPNPRPHRQAHKLATYLSEQSKNDLPLFGETGGWVIHPDD